MKLSHRLLFVGLFCFVPSSAAAGTKVVGAVESTRKRIVLAVGINEFKHAAPPDSLTSADGWARLQYAEKDAQDVAGALASFGFEPFEGMVLTGSVATYARIKEAISSIGEMTRTHAQDRYELIFYFSSHGFALKDENGSRSFLVAADSPSHRELRQLHVGPEELMSYVSERAIRRDYLIRDIAAQLGPNVLRTAVIFDACDVLDGKTELAQKKGHSTAAGDSLEAEIERVRRLDKAFLVFSSAASGQSAAELSSLKNSVYTHYLVRALSGSADNDARSIFPGAPLSLFAAHHWVRLQLASIMGDVQTPMWWAPEANVGAGVYYLEPLEAHDSYRSFLFRGEPFVNGYRMVVRLLDTFRTKGGADLSSPWQAELPAAGLALPSPGTYEVEIHDRSGEIQTISKLKVPAGAQKTVHMAAELGKRAHHSFAAGLGYETAAGEWGNETGLGSQPVIRARYGLEKFPHKDLHSYFNVQLGLHKFTDPFLGIQSGSHLSFISELEVDWSIGLGFGRILIGPALGAGFVRRTIEEAKIDDTHLLLSAGPRARGQIPLTESFLLEFDVVARAQTVAGIDDGSFFVGFVSGVAFRIPSVRVVEE